MRWALALLVLVGCTQTPEEKARDVCEGYCNCIDPGALPSVLDRCVTQQCLPQLPTVTDDCLTCVFEHDQVCPELFDQCDALCISPTQMPKLGGM